MLSIGTTIYFLLNLSFFCKGDFHWYRLDRNGKWSHKPGTTAITDRDGIGGIIADPRHAQNDPRRGAPNYRFVAFMLVNSNVVVIN